MGSTKERKTHLARGLRRRQSQAEKMLWARLRDAQVSGIKFRRQQPIGIYIADFVSFEQKLIIEVDGGQHNDVQVRHKDQERENWLTGEGFHLIRFWNNDVLSNMEGVLAEVEAAVG